MLQLQRVVSHHECISGVFWSLIDIIIRNLSVIICIRLVVIDFRVLHLSIFVCDFYSRLLDRGSKSFFHSGTSLQSISFEVIVGLKLGLRSAYATYRC